MQTYVKELYEQVKRMPVDEQIELADLIYLESGAASRDWGATWTEEAENRIDALERGDMDSVEPERMRAKVKALSLGSASRSVEHISGRATVFRSLASRIKSGKATAWRLAQLAAK